MKFSIEIATEKADSITPIMVELTDDIIVRLIRSYSPPYGGIEKLAPFCGNQWNEDWKWDSNELHKLKYSEKLELYEKLSKCKS